MQKGFLYIIFFPFITQCHHVQSEHLITLNNHMVEISSYMLGRSGVTALKDYLCGQPIEREYI